MANISQLKKVWSFKTVFDHLFTGVVFSETYFHFDKKMQPGDSPEIDVSQIQRGLFGMIIVVIMI